MAIKVQTPKGFIYSEQVANLIYVGHLAQKNVLLWGPAGHGKSEMTLAVLRNLGYEPFVQSFGEGMDEARLYGGLDLKALNEDNALVYNTERSFLSAQVAIFEELFDAPANVLLSLKDTLTARELRNGSQRVPMRAKFIVALTNKDPTEISQLGPSAHALIERFPLQMKVEWPSYEKRDYELLYKARGFDKHHKLVDFLSESLAELARKGTPVSPRTAVHAIQVVLTVSEGKEPEPGHYEALRYVQGLQPLADKVSDMAEDHRLRMLALDKLNRVERQIVGLESRLITCEDPVEALRVLKAARGLESALDNLAVPDPLYQDWKTLCSRVESLMEDATSKALGLVD